VTVGSWRVRARASRTVRVVGVLTVGAAGVAGCSAQSGAAAVVEGEAIPVSAVHEATEQLSPYLQDLTPSTVLLLLMAEPTFERVAGENGIAVSEQEARDVLETVAGGGEQAEGGEAAGPVPEFGPASVSVARFTLLQQGLGDLPNGPQLLEQVSAELADLDIEVNPRFGEVDFTEGNGITPVQRDWLVPAATAP